MDFESWQPKYVAVTNDLGYARDGDEAAAAELARLMEARSGPVAEGPELARLLAHQRVFVCGNGPTLESELGDHMLEGTVIAADGATGRLMRRGTFPEIVVTDLDGDLEAIRKASAQGSVVILHAHADNRAQVARWLAAMEGPVVPSVQCAPPAGTRNYGGLTDGDRAVYLADHFGAGEIVLAGFDFGDDEPQMPPEKHRKFIWGALLIAWLDNPRVMFFDEYLAGGPPLPR
ncbi:MAG TPA: 6-hydroxymethylpterin diphosphokinase MptE-like protein [Candidatus Thermoplasmatota archaeon]